MQVEEVFPFCTYSRWLSFDKVRCAYNEWVQIEVSQASADCQLSVGATPTISTYKTTCGTDALLFCARFVVNSESYSTFRSRYHSSRIAYISH